MLDMISGYVQYMVKICNYQDMWYNNVTFYYLWNTILKKIIFSLNTLTRYQRQFIFK